MEQNDIHDRVITHSVPVATLLNGMAISTTQEDYYLSAADFQRLKNGSSKLTVWAQAILAADFGFFLGFAPKILSWLGGGADHPSKYELGVFAVVALASAALWVAGLCFPNERSRLMKQIGKHFEEAPKSRTVIERKPR